MVCCTCSSACFGTEADDVVSWPLSGSNDTGWVQLDALVGADPILSSQATADWVLEFAPGAEISNVSFQVRDGSDGLMIDQPLFVANDIGVNLFDWRGWGAGCIDSFDGVNPYSDRLSPNSANGAGWTLPSDAVITELAFEALAPIDPITSFVPVIIPIYAQCNIQSMVNYTFRVERQFWFLMRTTTLLSSIPTILMISIQRLSEWVLAKQQPPRSVLQWDVQADLTC